MARIEAVSRFPNTTENISVFYCVSTGAALIRLLSRAFICSVKLGSGWGNGDEEDFLKLGITNSSSSVSMLETRIPVI
jgi:hypothetical protein